MVLVLREISMYKKILLPTDGSESAVKAAKHALWIACRDGADIIVLNVFEIYTPSIAFPISTLAGSTEDIYEPLKKEAEKISDELLDALKSSEDYKSCNVNIKRMVRQGSPYNEILKTVDEMGIDLVVMGSSGRHGFDRFVLGSETERVVRKSEVPVLVVP